MSSGIPMYIIESKVITLIERVGAEGKVCPVSATNNPDIVLLLDTNQYKLACV